jgi:hypothetical protein
VVKAVWVVKGVTAEMEAKVGQPTLVTVVIRPLPELVEPQVKGVWVDKAAKVELEEVQYR